MRPTAGHSNTLVLVHPTSETVAITNHLEAVSGWVRCCTVDRHRRTDNLRYDNLDVFRTRMIEDTPIAYVGTTENPRARYGEERRARGERGRGSHSLAIVAIGETESWVGAMGGFVHAKGGRLPG